jgi:hypothetical protein
MTTTRALLAGLVAGLGLPFGFAALSAACSDRPTTRAVLGEAGLIETSRADVPAPPVSRDARASSDRGTLAGATVVEIPDTPCKPHGGTSVVVECGSGLDDGGTDGSEAGGGSPAGSIGPIVTTVRVDARRAAQVIGSGGALLFDSDGASPSSALLLAGETGNAIGSEGALLGVAGFTSEGVRYARFDAQGRPVGLAQAITTEPATTVAVAGGGGRALVVWSSTDSVRARSLREGVVAGASFDVATNAATTFFTASIAYDGADGFGVAWSGARGPGAYELRFGHARDVSADLPDVELLTAMSPYSVVQIARTGTGYALLYNAPAGAFLARLDGKGEPVGALMRLAGATMGWGVAAQGSEIGVVARRSTGEIEFRSFAANGAALGDWVCFDAPSGDPELAAAIDSDAVGYAIVYRNPAHTNSLVRLDRLGTGP